MAKNHLNRIYRNSIPIFKSGWMGLPHFGPFGFPTVPLIRQWQLEIGSGPGQAEVVRGRGGAGRRRGGCKPRFTRWGQFDMAGIDGERSGDVTLVFAQQVAVLGRE